MLESEDWVGKYISMSIVHRRFEFNAMKKIVSSYDSKFLGVKGYTF